MNGPYDQNCQLKLQQLFHTFWGKQPMGAYIADHNGSLLAANPALCGLLDCQETDLLGLSFLQLNDPHDAEVERGLFEEMIGGRRDSYTLRKRQRTKSGKTIWGQSTASIFELSERLYCLWQVTDVTDCVEAEGQLRRLMSLIAGSNVAIYSYALDGTIRSWNQAAEALYGFSAAEMVGSSISPILPNGIKSELAPYHCQLAADRRVQPETVRLHKSGRPINVSLALSPIHDDSGQVIGGISIAWDIGEFKRLQQELTRVDRINLVGELAASISHEIRNPLTTIRGYMQLLGMKPELAPFQPQLSLVVAEVDQVTTIIDEFLQLAQPCSSDFSPTRLNSLVSLLLPVLRAEALFHNKQIITQICPVPPAMLDGKEIRQLLLNLVRNGLEAMQAGGRVWIRTGADKETVWLQVQDEGKGISPEDLPKLGNTFFSTKLEGTGLGLPVCYRIAERHRARITVESSPAGTTFTVAFPIDPVTEDGEQMPRELQPAPEGVQK